MYCQRQSTRRREPVANARWGISRSAPLKCLRQSVQLVSKTSAFCHGFLSPVQMEEEIDLVAADVQQLKPAGYSR